MSTTSRRTTTTSTAPKTNAHRTRPGSSKKVSVTSKPTVNAPAPSSTRPAPRPPKAPVRPAGSAAPRPGPKANDTKLVNVKPADSKAGHAKAVNLKTEKVKKPKLVRDSFTIPKTEYAALDELKLRAAKLGHPVKKSELLRAGIKALVAQSDAALLATLATVPSIKTGRPKKD